MIAALQGSRAEARPRALNPPSRAPGHWENCVELQQKTNDRPIEACSKTDPTKAHRKR